MGTGSVRRLTAHSICSVLSRSARGRRGVVQRPPALRPAGDFESDGLQIEHLREGGTLWDLARIYAPTQDPRRWIERVCELNHWPEAPNLRPYESFIIPDWRAWPQNIEIHERPDGTTELVPIDPYADGPVAQMKGE